MSECNYEQQRSQELYQEDSEKDLLLKENLAQNIFYVEPLNYQDLMRNFNFRNPTYGVTVEYRFLKTIQQCDFLESSQLQFYINLFRKAYPNVQLAAATCHFFADFIQQNQTNSNSMKSQISNNQSQVSKKQDSQQTLNENYLQSQIFSQNQNVKNEQIPNVSTQNDYKNSQISNQQTQQQNIQQNPNKIYAQSQIQLKPTQQQQQDIKSNKQQTQSAIFSNDQETNQTLLAQSQGDAQIQQQVYDNQSQIQQEQIPINNQAVQQNQDIFLQSSQNITKSNNDTNPITQQSLQNLSNTNQPINIEKNDQTAKVSQSLIISNQFIESNVNFNPGNKSQSMISEKQNDSQKKFEIPFDQLKIDQVQADQNKKQSEIVQPSIQTSDQQIQPPPEKKYHFQVTNVTIEKPVKQETIMKSQLPLLMKQFAEMNNLTEEQLKQQEFWYFPINQFQTHWISVVIHLKKKEIYYFDSYYKKIEQIIIQGINSILEYFNFNPQNFQIKPIYNQQVNGYDCGVFILLSLLYTLQMKQYNYNQKIATRFRKRILYILAVIGAQQDIEQYLLDFIIDQC